MSKPVKVHFDATKPGEAGRTALCGYTQVRTESDVASFLGLPDKARCSLCAKALRREAAVTKRTGAIRLPSACDFARELRMDLQPTAGPPPTLTAPLWASSCKGGTQGRCRTCPICEHEHEIGRWSSVAPWNDQARPPRRPRPEGAPQWRHVNEAIVALFNHEMHDRWGPSAMGGIIARLKASQVGQDGGPARSGEDALMRRGSELVAVRQALEMAYPPGGHRTLTSELCMALFVIRTPGVLSERPTYEQLVPEFGESVGALKACVRHGRDAVSVELAARGLIPWPKSTLGLAERIEAVQAALGQRRAS